MAEVIKYGVIGDPFLFEILESISSLNKISNLSNDVIEDILHRSASAKAKIVVLDEKESGLRAILNYGHTFGHVIENLCGYGNYLHGEAVGIGMVAVGQLALLRGDWKAKDADRQKKLIERAGLPIKWPELDPEKVLRALEVDKKVQEGRIRFVLPTKIGHVKITNDISRNQIKESLSIINS